MKNLITLCILILCINNLKGQNKSEKLEKLFDYYNELGVFNGVVLAAENDKIIFHKEYGFADFENKTPLKRNSLFAIGSTTKTLNATAIMMMEEDKLLSYEDTISKFITELPSFADSVTIRQLLTMTSGIPDYFRDWRMSVFTTEAVMDSLSKTDKLLFNPGTKYNYSSTNYLLLAKIIEHISGMNWGDYLKKNIFIPSGMNNTYAYPYTDSFPGRVEAYNFINWEKTDLDLKLSTYGGGNVYSCVDDLYAFTKALEGGLLLKSFASAYDTSRLNHPVNDSYFYGLGWLISRTNPGVVLHNGAVGGFNSLLWRNYEEHSTLIILCNNWWISRIPGIISGAQNIMLGKDFEYDKVTCTVPFYEIWSFKGFTAAINWLRSEYSNPSGKYSFQPVEINYLGYLFLSKKQFKEAIEVFRFCVEIYPDEYNLWDSLGEAYMTAGDKKNAIISYKKALELNPNCTTSKEALKKLEE